MASLWAKHYRPSIPNGYLNLSHAIVATQWAFVEGIGMGIETDSGSAGRTVNISHVLYTLHTVTSIGP